MRPDSKRDPDLSPVSSEPCSRDHQSGPQGPAVVSTSLTDHERSTRPGHSSLASTCETVTTVPPATCEGADPRWVISLTTQQIWPARCRRNRCTYCLPINARRRALAITYSGPQRMIRLSLMAGAESADPLDLARTRMKRLRQALTRMDVPAGEWSWTLERNPRWTGYHAHLVQRGPYLPQRALQEAALRAGAGFPHLKRIRATPGATARYGLKGFGAAGYGLKTFRADDTAMEALEINHYRVEHHTPEFFLIDGEKASVRDVECAAVEEIYQTPSDSYLVCDRRTAIYYMSPEGRNYLPAAVWRGPGDLHV